MTDDFNPDDWPNDYSNPNAIASGFEGVQHRLDELENEVKELRRRRGVYVWGFGGMLAMILSWSRNGSILYCVAHGIAGWIYVVYFAFTR